eukprot:scaffold1483_cov374-Pavlova_lutheri.AAC.23
MTFLSMSRMVIIGGELARALTGHRGLLAHPLFELQYGVITYGKRTGTLASGNAKATGKVVTGDPAESLVS